MLIYIHGGSLYHGYTYLINDIPMDDLRSSHNEDILLKGY